MIKRPSRSISSIEIKKDMSIRIKVRGRSNPIEAKCLEYKANETGLITYALLDRSIQYDGEECFNDERVGRTGDLIKVRGCEATELTTGEFN